MINPKQIMREVWCLRRNVMVVLAASLFLLIYCSKDKDSVGPGSTDGGVFSDDGGFIITYEMLDKQYNKISFPGTHNSAANHTTAVCENQGLGIWQQMSGGIRYIELDVNDALWTCHSAWCSFHDINYHFERFKEFAQAHSKQIITVKISDLCPGLGVFESYHRINGRLENTGLDQYIYNWDASKPKDDPGRCYIPDPWPTLREMIESGKNVMFLHHRDYGEFGIVDEPLYPGMAYSDDILHWAWGVTHLENLCKLMPIWDPPQERQNDGPNRLFLIEVDPDHGAPAGDDRFASINNDGRRLYQIAKQHETEILPDNRVANFIIVHYFRSSTAEVLPIDVVDACNRLNYERFGTNWINSMGFWELYPYEFDNSKVEYIHQIDAIRTEVDEAIGKWENHESLDYLDRGGLVTATCTEPHPNDWRRIAEWAVDGDLCTRWCCLYTEPYTQAWAIDLGERKSVNEIAIAWEYPHHRPGYIVFVSNNDSRFADGISYEELRDNTDWIKMAEGTRVAGGQRLLWDKRMFNNPYQDWRYIKISITDRGAYECPTFWEVKLYGPAN